MAQPPPTKKYVVMVKPPPAAAVGAGGAPPSPPPPPPPVLPPPSRDPSSRIESQGVPSQLLAVIDELKSRPGYARVSAAAITEITGIPVTDNTQLQAAIRGHPRIRVSADFSLSYNPEVPLEDKYALLQKLSLLSCGYRTDHIADSYFGAKADIEAMKVTAEIMYVTVPSRTFSQGFSNVIYYRHPERLYPLDLGVRVGVTKGDNLVATPSDLRGILFRGDAVMIGGSVYRVNTRVNSTDTPYSNKMKRSTKIGAQWSASSVVPHVLAGKNTRYLSAFDEFTLPLDRPYEGTTSEATQIKRFGCDGSIRQLWRRTMISPGPEDVHDDIFGLTTPIRFPTFPRTHEDLQAALKKAGMKCKNGSGVLRRDQKFAKATKTKKRSRSSRGTRLSNQHLNDTEAGRQLDEIRRRMALE